jgi:HAMP domain-containing protein
METTALRIDNTLRQNEMSARLEGGQVRVNRAAIDRLIDENGCLAKLRQTLPNAELYVTRHDSTQLGIYIADEESGYRRLLHEGNEMFIFTQPLGDRPFILTAVCPAEDVYGRYSRMQWFLWFRGVAGVLILLVILYAVVSRHLRPLQWLADSAQSIANGNLDTPIPDAHHDHEAGRLQTSLKKMQQALKAYMTEMQQKQVTLSKQNADLRDAYAEVQGYEEKKTNFVRDMTAQMAQPVESLCQQAESICREAATMTKEEMAQRQTVIIKDSETITQLLDNLMKETAQ